MLYQISLEKSKVSILGRTNENPPWRHDGRRTDYHHLLLIVSGSCTCRIENRFYDAEAGDLLFIPAKAFYRLTTDCHCEYCFACFHSPCFPMDALDTGFFLRVLPEKQPKFFLSDPESDRICISEHTSADAPARAGLLALFTRCQALYASGLYLDRLQIDLCFREILLCAAKTTCFGSQDKTYSLSIKRILQFIDQNYTEPITPESLSSRFSLSKEHICALFRKELGMTVSEYVNTVKLNHAVELLSNSSMNVSQISEYLGYSSVYYFSKLFKRRYGISPTGYAGRNS